MSPPAETAPAVLVADDHAEVREALRLLLKAEGFAVHPAESPRAALAAAAELDLDVVLMDLNYARDTTSGMEGMELLAQLQAHDPDLPVVVMTAWGTVELAVEAMRRGARDFVQKPWENERLLAVLRNQVTLRRALRRSARLAAENAALRGAAPEIIAGAPAMRPVLEMIARVAPSDANVLLTGENGTGKGVVARALHAASPRAGGPFVTVNAGGVAEGVFESELFGHVRGAFTDAKADRVGRFELANGGTLFLDEIADLPPLLQPKILRAVESREFERVGGARTLRVDVRIVCATNADIAEEIAAGRFRRDLLFRLNTVEIRLPPLRERREDILPLARHFLARVAARYRKPVEGFDAGAKRAMEGHGWPGNVRELEHAVERAVLMADGARVRAPDLGLQGPAAARPPGDLTLEETERLLIQKALARHAGNVSQAAAALGLSRSALYRRIARHGL